MSDWRVVCAPATAHGGGPFRGAEFCSPVEALDISPIDAYYELVEAIVMMGSHEKIENNKVLGRLLILGLVSGVEGYLRNVLAGILRICPAARKSAQDSVIPLSAFDYYDDAHIELGLFDGQSLASEKEIRRVVQKIIGIGLPQSGELATELQQFDVLCHLRHASVHAEGQLGSRNAQELGLDPTHGRHSIHMTYAGLQQAGAMCHRFVRSMNSWLWSTTLDRWYPNNGLLGIWTDDRPRFEALRLLLRSTSDNVGPATAKAHYEALPYPVVMRRPPARPAATASSTDDTDDDLDL